MKVCPTCQAQWADFVELCFKDGTPLVAVLVPLPPTRVDLANPPAVASLPEISFPPMDETSEENERPTLVAEPFTSQTSLPPFPAPDMDDVPGTPDETEEDTVLSVDNFGRHPALPAVDEGTGGEPELQVPKGPVTPNQTILPVDDQELRQLMNGVRDEQKPPEKATPAEEKAPPPPEKTVPERSHDRPEKPHAAPVQRAIPKVPPPLPPPPTPTPPQAPQPSRAGANPVVGAGLPLGMVMMGMVALTVAIVTVAVVMWMRGPEEGKLVEQPAENHVAAPANPPVTPPTTPPAAPTETPPVAPTETPPVAPTETPPAPPVETPPVAPPATATAPVEFKNLVAGATIKVDGQPYTVGQPMTVGMHEVRVEAPGYAPTKLMVNVTATGATVTPKMTALGKPVIVNISCVDINPCTVTIDGGTNGKNLAAPVSRELPEGQHNFRITGACSLYLPVKAAPGSETADIQLRCGQ